MTEQELYEIANGARMALAGMFRCEHCDRLVPLMSIEERFAGDYPMRLCKMCVDDHDNRQGKGRE